MSVSASDPSKSAIKEHITNSAQTSESTSSTHTLMVNQTTPSPMVVCMGSILLDDNVVSTTYEPLTLSLSESSRRASAESRANAESAGATFAGAVSARGGSAPGPPRNVRYALFPALLRLYLVRSESGRRVRNVYDMVAEDFARFIPAATGAPGLERVCGVSARELQRYGAWLRTARGVGLVLR